MREPSRQRFLDALNRVERPDVALFELEADIAVVNGMLEGEFHPSLHSYELPAPDLAEWNRRMGNDMVYFSHIWRLGRKEQVDSEGRIHYVDGTMKTRASLDDLRLPDLDDIERRFEALLQAADGEGFGFICGAQTAGFTVPTAIGYADFCLLTLEDPDFVLEFQKRVHDYAMGELEMYARYPVDAVKLGSGLVANAGPMLHPDEMEVFDWAYIREQIAFCKEQGWKVILHIDGDVGASVPLFLEMGADALHPIDPCGGRQDIYELKRLYGSEIALCGNIDVNGVLLYGSPEEVRRDVRRHIDRLAPGGGYVVGSSHDLHHLIPVENVLAMRDAVHEHVFQGAGAAG